MADFNGPYRVLRPAEGQRAARGYIDNGSGMLLSYNGMLPGIRRDNGFETDSGHEINFFIIVFVLFLGPDTPTLLTQTSRLPNFMVYVFCKTAFGTHITTTSKAS